MIAGNIYLHLNTVGGKITSYQLLTRTLLLPVKILY